ncbi:flagellar basal body-associated FliL family protein [bacterium]|nr:flagellar basal body-associated FliL family protein [bacterium]
MADEPTPQETPETGKKSKKKILILAVIGVLVLAVGAGGAFFMMKGESEAPETGQGDEVSETLKEDAKVPPSEKHKAKKDAHGDEEEGHEGEAAEETVESLVFTLSRPIVTNLLESKRTVYAEVWFEATDAESLSFLRENEHYLMDTLVFLFGGKTTEDMTSPEGKDQLKREIQMRVDAVVSQGKVKNVGFYRLQTN